jgi:mannose-6-phosphate isomerase-like protein (cupin superfamily)
MIFDGRIWHTGRNDADDGTRTALLLQYAAADMALRMPATEDYRWPFKFGATGRLPAVLVGGSDRGEVNRLVPPPPPLQSKEAPMITTRANTVELPLAEDPVKRWRIYRQFRGPTRTFESMSCHISVLSAGHVPHPPHIHPEEELLIVLDGEVEIALATHPDDQDTRKLRLRPGQLSYYPSTQHHTIYNPGTAPVTYLMFKWRAGDAGSRDPLPASVFSYGDKVLPPDAPAYFQQRVFEQATHSLGKLHAHLTTLQPGAGYAPHVDAYDVAILVLSGEIETLGAQVKPLGIVYYAAGESHGMRNVGTVAATYLVFEFHSPAAVALRVEAQRQAQARRAAEKAARKAAKAKPRGLLGRLGKLLKRLR